MITKERFREELKERSASKFESLTKDEVRKIAKRERKSYTIAFTIAATIFLGFAITVLALAIAEEMYELLLFAAVLFMGVLSFLFLMIFMLKKSDEYHVKRHIKFEINKNLKTTLETEDDVNKLKNIGFEVSKFFAFEHAFFKDKLFFDNNNGKIVALHYRLGKETSSKVYKYTDILSYEICENGKQVVQGAVGRSLIGGFFLGLEGAIAGAAARRRIDNICEKLELIIRVKDFDAPQINMIIISEQCDKRSFKYEAIKERLRELCSTMEYIINSKQPEDINENQVKTDQPQKNTREMLEEYKTLLEDGLISPEDYEQKKKEILGL